MERHICNKVYPIIVKFIWLFSVVLALGGCGSRHHVPVRDISTSNPEVYKVKSGETLYAIAWRYGKDYRDIAKLNNISAPYKIKVGQRLRIIESAGNNLKSRNNQVLKNNNQAFKLSTSASKKVSRLTRAAAAHESKANGISNWLWPVKGKVIVNFAARGGINKGIDIVTKSGASVQATASGKVVYSGSGLRGYGELIIIKHNEVFLSAYAHNKKLLVQEGEVVKAGQIIAEAGNSDAKQVLLHFEIRRAGKPVDPLKYLPGLN